MATFKIKQIYRDTVNTKYGEKENIKIVPDADSVMDINGDPIVLNGRKITGFRDKLGETDKWEVGTTIKVQVATKKSIGKEGDEMEWVNFRLPEGVSSVVEEASQEVDPNTVNVDDF